MQKEKRKERRVRGGDSSSLRQFYAGSFSSVSALAFHRRFIFLPALDVNHGARSARTSEVQYVFIWDVSPFADALPE